MLVGGISHLLRQDRLNGLLSASRLMWMLRGAYLREDSQDLYHVNWLQCAIPLPADGKPALITVLGNDMKLLKLPLVTRLIRKAMRGRRVLMCPNAEWMCEPLQSAFGDLASIEPVVFGIDPTWFAVHRLVGNRPAIWLAVTRVTHDKLGHLLEWSQPLFEGGDRELHLFGPMQERVELPEWVNYHGPVTAAELADHWFPKAQGLITLSRHAEGRPQVMLEAMAAGLPIIASDMPAHASLVRHGITGMLCASHEDFSEALTRLEDRDFNLAAGESARALIREAAGTWDDCALRYANLYRRLLEPALNV